MNDSTEGQDPQAQQSQSPAAAAGAQAVQASNNSAVSQVRRTQSSSKPRSLYPASILGLAMVARGEIGFLIASLAETDGIFAQKDAKSQGSSEMYLVIVWAITLCTIIGPICVGTLVKRVKTLQSLREHSGGEDPLGVWGV